MLPASGVSLLYFGFAHVCLALAFASLLVQPGLPAGFFHHPQMIAIIHLVMLGWMLAAILLGIAIGLSRLFGWLAWPPMSAAFAHVHLAAVGWAMMMVVGLSYRLIPMILPAAMPALSLPIPPGWTIALGWLSLQRE